MILRATLGMVIDEMFSENIGERGYEVEIVVIDNHISNGTRKLLKTKGQSAVKPMKEKGRAAMLLAMQSNSDLVFILEQTTFA